MLLISSCLAGEKVRYDGGDCFHRQLKQWVDEGKAVFACPELLGGLSIPREPAEIIGGDGEDVLKGKGKVMTMSGQDVTNMFVEGAYRMLDIARQVQASTVVLKEKSPSCGSSTIYNGSFSGEKITGQGVTAALLKRHGYRVLSEAEFEKILSDHT